LYERYTLGAAWKSPWQQCTQHPKKYRREGSSRGPGLVAMARAAAAPFKCSIKEKEEMFRSRDTQTPVFNSSALNI